MNLPKFVWNQKKYQKVKRLWRNWRLKNGQKFLGLFNKKIDSDSEIPSLFSSRRVHFGQKFLGKLSKTSTNCNFFCVSYLFKSFWYFMHDQLFSTLELRNLKYESRFLRFHWIFKTYVVKISRVFNPNLDTFVHRESIKSRLTFHQLIENGFPLEHLWTWYVGTSVQNIF